MRANARAKRVKRIWLPTTPKQPKFKVPQHEKQLAQQKCHEIIETEFKPKYIEQPPTDNDFNYRVKFDFRRVFARTQNQSLLQA